MARQASGKQTVSQNAASQHSPVKAARAAAAPSKSAAKPAKKATAATRPAALKLDGLSAEQKVVALLKDRERLLAIVDGAESRVKRLEDREAALIDRISWALDTLNDLLKERN